MYVTYQDLIQIGILVVALANLIYQIYKGKGNSRHYQHSDGCWIVKSI